MGTGESSASPSWVVEDGAGNGITGGAENKKITAADSETKSRTASAGPGLDDDASAVGDGAGCSPDGENDDNVDGGSLESAIDLDSVEGAFARHLAIRGWRFGFCRDAPRVVRLDAPKVVFRDAFQGGLPVWSQVASRGGSCACRWRLELYGRTAAQRLIS
jgi:hypothetical protein